MKIAIPTNDRKTIAKRTGRAAEFAIYHIENGEIISIDHQKNTHEHDDNHDRKEGNHRQGNGGGHRHSDGHGKSHGNGHHHGEHGHNHEHGMHSHDEIITQLKGIDILLVRAIGKYMKKDLQSGNITYKLVKEDEIDKIIATHLKSDN